MNTGDHEQPEPGDRFTFVWSDLNRLWKAAGGCPAATLKSARQILQALSLVAHWARGDVHVNTAESSHALVKRGIVGIYHNVSSEYLHRYLWQYDFLWNNRQLNDGERTIRAIQSAEGKRLMYKPPIARA